MAITFYDDISSPKLVLGNSSTAYNVSLAASTSTTEESAYILPTSIPSTSGKVLSTTSEGVMSWIALSSQDYIASRSGNLISNFSGHLGDNTNFSAFVLDTTLSPPAFKKTFPTQSLQTVFIDEHIVVDPNQKYVFSTWVKWNSATGGYFSMALRCFDIDNLAIKAKHTMYIANTTTTLAQELNQGDDYIYLNSLDNWTQAGTDIQRSFIIWNWESEGGHNYLSHTYSRNVLQNAWTAPEYTEGTDIIYNGSPTGGFPLLGVSESGWDSSDDGVDAYWFQVGTDVGIQIKNNGTNGAWIENVNGNMDTIATVANTLYKITYEVLENNSSSGLIFQVGSTTVVGSLEIGTHTLSVTTTSTGGFYIYNVSPNTDFTIDDVTCKSQTLITIFDYNSKKIALLTPWAGATVAAATAISQGSGLELEGQDERDDKYIISELNYEGVLPTDFQKYSGTIGGIDLTGTGNYAKFFPGTHSVKPGWVGDDGSNVLYMSNPFFGRNYSSDGGNSDNIGNSNLTSTETVRTFTLNSDDVSSAFTFANGNGTDKILQIKNYSAYSYVPFFLSSYNNTSTGSLHFPEALNNGTNFISLSAPLSIENNNAYTLPAAFPGADGYVLSSTTSGTMSWQAGGTGGGGEDSIYHTIENVGAEAGEGYYHDSYQGSKHLNLILQNRRSDIIMHQPITDVQYYVPSTGQWVPDQDGALTAEIKKLLDGRRDTVYNASTAELRFRFQVEVSTPRPLQTMVAIQTGWSGAAWPGCTISVEELVSNEWITRISADLTTANSCTNWGLSAYASQELHTGEGGSGNTRIEVDFSNFNADTVDGVLYNTVPLQSLQISSNYAGTETHDYHNIINYDRDLVIPNSIRHEGDTTNHIALGTNSQTYYTSDVERVLINDTGFRLGGDELPDGADSATVTGIDPDVALGGTVANSSHTLLVTQKAVKVYIHSLLFNGGVQPDSPNDGLSPGMIGDGSVDLTKWGYLNTLSGNVQSQLSAGASNTTANAAAITAIQATLKDDTGGGGKGVYSDSGKSQSSSYLSISSSTATIQAGSNTKIEAEESSPGTLTMSVQAGGSGNEVSVDAITIAGNSSVHNATTTFNQKAVFSMQAEFDSTVDLNGNATGISTSEVTEGTNLYYTDARVQTYLSGGSATTIETSGDVTVGGNLIVSGTQTQLNTTTLEVEDINIVIGKLATTSTLTNGAGLTFGAWSSGTIPTLTWDHANTRLSSNKNFYAPIIKTGNIHLDNSGSPVVVTSPIEINFQIDGNDRLDITTSGITVGGNINLSGTVDGIDIATDVAANTAKTGITSAQASEITANTAKVSNVSTALTVTQQSIQLAIGSDGNSIVLPAATSTLFGVMSPAQASAIATSTALNTVQTAAIALNTAKTSFPGLGTTSSTALAGDTSLLALGTSSTTALAGDTTTISSAQASAITANTAKISYSTAASDAVALNTAKTGITSSQASEITANTAKVSNIVQTTITGNAGTATQLAQTVSIGGVDFDGQNDVDLPGVNETGDQDTTGNAATATTLATARNIGGVSFNGSAAITLPGVDAAGTQDTSGNAATATKIASITNTDIVQLAGAQTLSGVKTFSSSIVSPGITSASNGNIVIDPDGTGSITLKSDNIIFEGAGTVTLPSLKLSEATLLEGNYVGFVPPLSITSNVLWTLPGTDGTSGQALKTSGAGVLSWTTVLDGTNDTLLGTTSVKPVGGVDGRIAFYNAGESNYVLLQAHDDLASDYTLRLPTADGSANQVLKTDGSGNLGWSTPSSGGGAVDMPLMTLGGRVQHSTSYDNRMIICGGTYGPTYYIWSSPAGVTASSGGTVDSTTFTLSTTYQHYGAIRVPTAGQIKVDFLAKPLNSSSYSKPYVLQVWEFTPAIDTSTGPTCTLRGKVDMTSSASTSKAVSATITTTSDVAAGSYIFVTIGMDAQTLTTTAYQYMNINLSILA